MFLWILWDTYKRMCVTAGMILGLCPTNERQRYFVTMSLMGWAQTKNQPCSSQSTMIFCEKKPLKTCSHTSKNVFKIADWQKMKRTFFFSAQHWASWAARVSAGTIMILIPRKPFWFLRIHGKIAWPSLRSHTWFMISIFLASCHLRS